MAKWSDFDHPVVFLIIVTMGVVALLALGRMGLAKLGWTGPLGLFTMGTQNGMVANGS